MEQCLTTFLDQAEARMRQAISRLPDGEYYYEDYLENSGASPDPVPVRGRMKIEGDSLLVDFSGSAAQVVGPTNMGPAGGPTSVFVTMKSFLDPASPLNSGAFRPIQVVSPEGSFLNARYPAPMGGFFEALFGVLGAVWGLLAQVMPQGMSAAVQSGVNHTYVGGWDPVRHRYYLLYEYPQGGTTACLENDGNNETLSFVAGDIVTIYPVERMEIQQPLFVERNGLRVDSGGPGYRRGGLGLRRKVRVLSPTALLSILGADAILPRPGMSGGYGGLPNRFTVIRGGLEIQPSDIPQKVAGFPLKYGDVVVMQARGGSGFGDPLAREMERVRQDVADGYVSELGAREGYGVVIVDGAVDLAKTSELREQLRKERAYIRVVASEADEYDPRGCRLCAMCPQLAGRLGVKEGDVVWSTSPSGGLP